MNLINKVQSRECATNDMSDDMSVSYPVAKECIVADVAQHFKTSNKIKSFRRLANEGKDLEPLKKIFGNYILQKSTTLFPSERGVGKSFLAMQLSIAVSSGKKEFLGEEIELNGNVLYINLELGEHTLKKRLERLYSSIEDDMTYNADCLTSNTGIVPIMKDIEAYCIEFKPVLVIIDNLRTAFTGSDNERNKEMTEAMTKLNKFKSEYELSLLIIHHLKKGTSNQLTNSDMQSGAGALSDLVDADFFLRKSSVDKDLRILKRCKSRECEEQEGAKLIMLNPENLWFEFVEEGVDEGEHIYFENPSKDKTKERYEALKKQGLSNSQIAKEIGVHRSTIGRW
jgi:predicted ATP-dependent serine protease